MAEHVDTLDFFGRLENRLALVDTDARARQTQAFAALGPLGMAT